MFRITSSVLEKINSIFINFGVKTINRYKFDVEIVGENFVNMESVKFYYNDQYDPEIGKYHDENTVITFEMDTIASGKYNINVLNSDLDFVNKDVSLILTEDFVLTITVTPKLYQVSS